MDAHAQKDKQYHAEIAAVYDYITNEPRHYPNELLFRPIDRHIKPARLMLDLGCGTGQMLFRYGHLAERIIAVDHSPEMIARASFGHAMHAASFPNASPSACLRAWRIPTRHH